MSKKREQSNKTDVDYFHNTEPSKWALVEFLKWRSQFPDFSSRDYEHGVFLRHIKEAAKGGGIKSRAAHRIWDNWKNEKDSLDVKQFWASRDIENFQHEMQIQTTKKLLQIESSDWDYVINRDKELSAHVEIVRSKRRRLLARDDEKEDLLELSISDDDQDDGLVELSLPEEESVQQIETNEIPSDFTEQDWSKWAKLLRKAKKSAQHKHSPENFNIIQCGSGISRSAYMSKAIYDSLQTIFPKTDRSCFMDCEAYIFAVLEKTSLEDMQQALITNKPPVDKPPGDKFKFIYRLFDQFANYVFKPGKKISQVKSSEVCYNHLLLWPCLYAAINGMTTSTFGDVEFSPRDIELLAVAKVQMLRNQTESQHKADGVVHTQNLHMELLFLETTGHHGLSDRPRAGWDHIKGMNGVLAMLTRIAYAFPYGSAEDFKNMKVAFIHAHGDDLHLWTVSIPSPGIYIMQRVIKALVPVSFTEKHHLASLINFFWTVRVEISKMIDALEKLKKTHDANELAIMLKGNRSGVYLPDLLKPVENIPNNPKSSSVSEYD